MDRWERGRDLARRSFAEQRVKGRPTLSNLGIDSTDYARRRTCVEIAPSKRAMTSWARRITHRRDQLESGEYGFSMSQLPGFQLYVRRTRASPQRFKLCAVLNLLLPALQYLWSPISPTRFCPQLRTTRFIAQPPCNDGRRNLLPCGSHEQETVTRRQMPGNTERQDKAEAPAQL